MAGVTQIQVIISAQDNASKVINDVGNSFKGAANDINNNAKAGAAGTQQLSYQMYQAMVQARLTQAANQQYMLGVAAIGVAAIGAGAVSLKMASDFQSSMLLVQTQAGASKEEVQRMTKAVLDLAPAVGQTPQQLAQGLYYVESAGFSGAKALDILKLSAEGAAVGHEDLATMAKTLTSVMNSQITGVHNATDAMGVLDAIVGHGKMTMSDLSAAIATGILPAAKTAGVSIQQLGAALDVMTNNGIPAQDAATRLRMTLSLMEAPSDQAKKSLASVGLSATSLAYDMQHGGIIQAVTDLNTHMNAVQQGSDTIVKGTKMTGAQLAQLGNNILDTTARLKILNEEHVKAGVATDRHNLAIQEAQQKLDTYNSKLGSANTVIKSLGGTTLDAVGKAELLTKAFGGARSGSSIELLSQQTDALAKSLSGINETSSRFASSWAATQNTAQMATQKFNASVQVGAIELGMVLLPAYTSIVNVLTGQLFPAISAATSFITQHKAILSVLAGVIVGLLAPAVVMLSISTWGLITTQAVLAVAFFAAWWPLIAIVAAVAAVIFLVATHMDLIKAAASAVGNFLVSMWNGAVKGVSEFFNWIGKIIQANKDMLTVILAVALPIIGVPLLISQHWSQIVTFFQSTWKSITNTFNNFIKWITATFSPAFKVAMAIINFVMIVVHDLFVVAWFAIQQVMTQFVGWLNATFGPSIHTSFNGVQTFLTALKNFFTATWNAIKSMLTAVGNWFNATFAPMINVSFTFIKQLLTDLGSFFTTTWNDTVSFLTGVGNWIGKEFTGLIQTAFDFIGQQLNALYNGWIKIWNSIKSFVVGIANDIAGAVKSMLNSIIGFFNNLINGANKVGSKVPGYVSIPSIPTFSTGGIVPGQIGQPVLIMAHGGETVTPLGTSRGSDDSGGGNLTLQVNIGLYAGSDTEKRNIARQLYAALLQLAQSQHKTVAQYMGG